MIAEPRVDRTDPQSARDLRDVVSRVGRVLRTLPRELQLPALLQVIGAIRKELGCVVVGMLLIATPVAAEPAMIAGKVAWLVGPKITVSIPVQQFGQRGSVTVDLSEVPQSDLAYIRAGDQVIIYGELQDERFAAGRVIKKEGGR